MSGSTVNSHARANKAWATLNCTRWGSKGDMARKAGLLCGADSLQPHMQAVF